MAVVNIPPDRRIYDLGLINGSVHVYNTGNPPGGATVYSITILNVGAWTDVPIQIGHTHTYPAGGNRVYVQNMGPSKLQVLYVTNEMTVAEAGGHEVKAFPAQAAGAPI